MLIRVLSVKDFAKHVNILTQHFAIPAILGMCLIVTVYVFSVKPNTVNNATHITQINVIHAFQDTSSAITNAFNVIPHAKTTAITLQNNALHVKQANTNITHPQIRIVHHLSM